MSVETILGCLAVGGVGLLLGFLAGLRVGQNRAEELFEETRHDLEARHAAAQRGYEASPARLENIPRREAAPPPPAQRPAAAAPRAHPVEHLPIKDERPNEDRTVFRKLRSAVDAFRQSQDRLDSLDDRTVVKVIRNPREDAQAAEAKKSARPANPRGPEKKPSGT